MCDGRRFQADGAATEKEHTISNSVITQHGQLQLAHLHPVSETTFYTRQCTQVTINIEQQLTQCEVYL